MNFLEIAKKRYSVRKYQERPVEKEKLDQILEAGRVAPTGANRQPQRLFVVQSEAGHAKIDQAAKTFGAPVVIVVCSNEQETWERSYDGKKLTDIDAAIVTDHMMLQATELGLGSVWICWFKPTVLKEVLNLPEELVPINILAIGYPDGEPASPDRHVGMRKPLDETVTYL